MKYQFWIFKYFLGILGGMDTLLVTHPQAFKNCVHSYEHVHNGYANGVICAERFWYGIDPL